MDAAYIESLASVLALAAKAGHGQKESVYRKAAQELGISRATLLAHLAAVSVRPPRKRRSDAGAVALSFEEANKLSAYLNEGYRKNNRKVTSLKEAVKVLRMNGEISATFKDAAGNEIRYLSESAIARALRAHCLHPGQMRQPTPHVRLRSLHPNHVWQVDASVCVIYYLPTGQTGLSELDQAVHYKNKPENLRAIEQFRVIRYVLVDHASGVVRYRYYPHAESGQHTVRFLAWAMAKKPGNDPFHGAPLIVMVDPGATSGGLVRRFCDRLGIELIVNKPHNARAKGGVEKGNHLVECSFEQALRYMSPRPASFEELNRHADRFQLDWNGMEVHGRTKRTRFGGWMEIKQDQLRVTPDERTLLELATQEPEKRQAQGDLSISFRNRKFDVSQVPGVTVKGDIYVHWHPFITDTAMAVVWGDDGHERHIALPEQKRDAWGFYENAAIIGQEHKAMPDTVADTNRKRIQRLAAGTATLEATEKKRESKHYIPFDGRIDPFIAAKQQPLPAYIDKRGVALEAPSTAVELLRLSPAQMAKWLWGRLGEQYDGSILPKLVARFPSGATEPELEQVLADLDAGRTLGGRARLQAV